MWQIVCVGKIKQGYWREAAEDYSRRFGLWQPLKIVELADEGAETPAQVQRAMEREGQRILAALPAGVHVVLLDIDGRAMDSESFAAKVSDWRNLGRVCFVIGGSFGVSQAVRARAYEGISLSQMTFPHAAARALLCEQLYRAACILQGRAYHK